ncbi:MAG: TetR/AcrR family transcriptional regulator [Marinobacter sp.]|nr:TetR/AcrR family transcriptional regulator [Marinobacter sp.]
MGYQDQVFAQREQLLLTTARELFLAHGWEQVSVARVAEAAGIGKGTVYRHFPTKEAIYAQLVLAFSRRCLETYRQMPAEANPLLTMHRIIRRAFDLMNANRMEVQLCLHCERPEFQDRLDDAYRARFRELDQDYFDLFNGLAGEAVAGGLLKLGSVEEVHSGVETAFHGVMTRIAIGGFGACYGPETMESYFDHVADFLMAGIVGTSQDAWKRGIALCRT